MTFVPTRARAVPPHRPVAARDDHDLVAASDRLLPQVGRGRMFEACLDKVDRVKALTQYFKHGFDVRVSGPAASRGIHDEERAGQANGVGSTGNTGSCADVVTSRHPGRRARRRCPVTTRRRYR